jgi:hypothetical protein
MGRAGAFALALLFAGAGPATATTTATTTTAAVTAQAARQHRAPGGLVIESISPVAAAPTSKIVITGYLQNSSNQPITGLTVRLRFSHRAVASRGELAQQAGGAAAPLLLQIGHPQRFARPVAPGARQAWRLATTSEELGFTSFGVYPLSVEADDAAGRVIGAQRTFMTFVPKDYKQRLKPTQIAWVWPMMDVPHRTINDRFRDDHLAASLAAGGRLNDLVAAARTSKFPLTWAIDPALVDDARTMTSPYTIEGARHPKSGRHPKSDAAARWLADLKSAVGGQAYFATPYADPDVAALVHRGRVGDLKYAYSAPGTEAVRSTIGRPPEPIAWPPEGAADQNTLNQLSRLGSRLFLLSSDVLPGAPALTYTPSAAVALQTSHGTKYAVAGDQPISSAIADTRGPGAEVLAEQRFLAETALVTAERPGLQRTVVVVPPRRWNPSRRFAERLLADTDAARWLQPASLDEVTRSAMAGSGGAGDAPVQRTFAGYPAAYGAHELSAVYLDSVRAIEMQALPFSTIFDPPLTGYREAVLRLESSAWRGGKRTAARARSARNALKAKLADDMKTIHFVLNKGPSLAGEVGQVPVTIANDMPGHSITINLKVASAQPGRLKIGKFQSLVTIPPLKKVTIQIPMKAAANGKTPVTLTLLSRGHKSIGVDRQMQVNATGFGQTALLITGGALVVLFLGVGVRVIRARRRTAAAATARGAGHPGGVPPGPKTITGADREART